MPATMSVRLGICVSLMGLTRNGKQYIHGSRLLQRKGHCGTPGRWWVWDTGEVVGRRHAPFGVMLDPPLPPLLAPPC